MIFHIILVIPILDLFFTDAQFGEKTILKLKLGYFVKILTQRHKNSLHLNILKYSGGKKVNIMDKMS